MFNQVIVIPRRGTVTQFSEEFPRNEPLNYWFQLDEPVSHSFRNVYHELTKIPTGGSLQVHITCVDFIVPRQQP